MKIVIAPNAFKESLSASEAAEAMALGAHAACPDVETVCCPVADGGDGFVDVMAQALGGEVHSRQVTGPAWEPVEASFAYVQESRTALIEMASASGLALLSPEHRNPIQTTTRGTGELMHAALELGATRIVVGIGGSATCDGGIGVAEALGVEFLDARELPVRPVGGELAEIRDINTDNLDPRVRDIEIDVICDVTNPLYGEYGAAYVYGPQKGATPSQVEMLDKGLRNLSAVIERDLGFCVASVPGGGAAGGLGAGLMAFLGARLRPGVETVLGLVGLESMLDGADLVLTAEGALDGQTVSGKAPAGVAMAARKRGVPCMALAGHVARNVQGLHAAGVNAAFSLCNGPMELSTAMRDARDLLAAATEQAVRAFLAGRQTIRM